MISQTVSVLLAHVGLDLDAVAQQAIDGLVDIVEALGLVAGDLVEFVQGAVDERLAVALALEEGAQIGLFDVAVVRPLFPVAQVVVAQGVAEQLDDAVLGETF